MKRIKERLEALEQGSTSDQQRITCIELVDAETGEVGGVIHIGGQPDQAGVTQALEYKHENSPASCLRAGHRAKSRAIADKHL